MHAFLLFHGRERSFGKQAGPCGGACSPPWAVRGREGGESWLSGLSVDPLAGPGSEGWSGQAHSQAEATDVTLVILVESSDQGCRFCRAKSEEL